MSVTDKEKLKTADKSAVTDLLDKIVRFRNIRFVICPRNCKSHVMFIYDVIFLGYDHDKA